jgi:2-succinyl-5-enolpyruvyl-6-hydroxy-3-cyclohexene-1-carboxylate synthase
VQELARSGIAHVVISPGSRSTPLALACSMESAVRTFVLLDERGAAFFALGLAKTSRKPVALLCTSGTAAANYLPAVVEAAQSQVPLLVLTADRPPEAREWGASQTIEQVGLYGRFARWAVDLPVPEVTPSALAHLRQTVCRAVATASRSPRGPVHLNVPFRDPLPPIPVADDVPDSLPAELVEGRTNGRAFLELPATRIEPEEASLRAVAKAVAGESNGLIAVGPLDGEGEVGKALAKLAEVSGYPLLAEAVSSARFGQAGASRNQLSSSELMLRSESFVRAHPPRLVLKLGQALTSKAVTRYVESAGHTIALAEAGAFPDPSHLASTLVQGDLLATIEQLTEHVRALNPTRSPGWLDDFRLADRTARSALEEVLGQTDAVTEMGAAATLFAALPDDVPLWVASSMPIRDLEAVAPASERRVRVLANRGANGIDGTLSSALGAAAAGHRAALLIGDVAMVHDLNGLLAARSHRLSLTVLLINNDGGGIFSFLDVAKHSSANAFESLFGTPHGVDFSAAVAAFGGTHRVAENPGELRSELDRAFEQGGLQVVEVRTQRDENVRAHQRVWDEVRRRLEGQPWHSST